MVFFCAVCYRVQTIFHQTFQNGYSSHLLFFKLHLFFGESYFGRSGFLKYLFYPFRAECLEYRSIKKDIIKFVHTIQSMKYQNFGSVPKSSFNRKTFLFSNTHRIVLLGSNKFPNILAPVGQASAQAGFLPARER